MKIIFMGSPSFAIPTLNKLAESKNHKVVAAYSQPPKPARRGMDIAKSRVHMRAEELSIPIYTPASLKNEAEQQEFKNLKADIAVVAAYGLLLPKQILEGTKFGCINIHPSTLPRWRGAAPIQRAVMAGDKETSVCIMKMDEGLDTGDIYAETFYDIPSDASARDMHDLLAEQGAELLLKVLDNFENYSSKLKKQSTEGVEYAKKITPADEIIDFNNQAEFIYNQIRGLSPYPGAYFMCNGSKYKVFSSNFSIGTNLKAGEIITEKNKINIACKNGFIEPLIIQKEGKKKMEISEFLKGNKF